MSYSNKSVKKILSLFLLAALLMTLLAIPALAKSRVSLSRTKVTLKPGKTVTIRIKGFSKKARWSVSGKKLVTLKTKGRKRLKAVIKAKDKAGKCCIKVRVGRKTLKCRITVKKVAKKKIEPGFKEKPLTGDSTEISSNYTRNAVTGKSTDDTFISAFSDTSVKMLKHVCASDSTGNNILISPDSILTAMAMTESGASGNTLAQMETAFGGISSDDYNKYLYTLNKRLTGSKNVIYNIADSIWYRDDGDIKLEVKDDFIQNNIDYFNAAIFKAPFSILSVQDINTWVYNKTRGMIPSIIDKLNDDHMMVLINAIAFEGEWLDKYGSSYKDYFTFENGTKKKVDMLQGSESTLVKVGSANGFVKPYKGNTIAFLGLETPEGMTVDEFVQNLNGSDFAEGYKNRKTENVQVNTWMPEFKYDFNTSLVNTMKELGIEDAFDGAADFSRISEFPVLISDIIHKTHIEVTKDGTKAAAATAVEMAKNSAPPFDIEKVDVHLDHPFVYAIIDTASGLPLFIGVMKTL